MKILKYKSDCYVTMVTNVFDWLKTLNAKCHSLFISEGLCPFFTVGYVRGSTEWPWGNDFEPLTWQDGLSLLQKKISVPYSKIGITSESKSLSDTPKGSLPTTLVSFRILNKALVAIKLICSTVSLKMFAHAVLYVLKKIPRYLYWLTIPSGFLL